MRMDFRLLVVDDRPDSFEQAVQALEEFLERKGFSLSREVVSEFSRERVQEMAHRDGKNYDLVIVDYNLGHREIDGAKIAQRLRAALRFTDMVFYSSDTSHDLYAKLAEEKVSGAFVASRDELDDQLIGRAETVIGKVADLSHLRGVAMAEVADMDVVMQAALREVLRESDADLSGVRDRTINRLREGIGGLGERLDGQLAEGGLERVIEDPLLFSAAPRFRATARVAKALGRPTALVRRRLAGYETDILAKRNMLAHAREWIDEEGQTRLQSGEGCDGLSIDEEWMTEFRVQLRTYRAIIDEVCEAIQERPGPGG